MDKRIENMVEKYHIRLGWKGIINPKRCFLFRDMPDDDFEFFKEHKEDFKNFVNMKRFEKEFPEKLEEAKETGEPVLYESGMEPCNGEVSDCSFDYVTKYIKVTGEKVGEIIKREHCY